MLLKSIKNNPFSFRFRVGYMAILSLHSDDAVMCRDLKWKKTGFCLMKHVHGFMAFFTS